MEMLYIIFYISISSTLPISTFNYLYCWNKLWRERKTKDLARLADWQTESV